MSDPTPPHNLEAERSVLGAVLLHSETLDVVVGIVPASAFYRRAHQQIYGAMVELHAAQATIDLVTLKNRLAQKGELESVGGPAYISSLVDGFPQASNVEHYAAIVREKALLRQLMVVGQKLHADAAEAEQTALTVVAEADAALMRLAGEQLSGDLVPASALMSALFPVIEDAYAHKRAITGLPTIFPELNEFTLGLHPGTLIYVAGRPSQGKSALSLNIAAGIALLGKTVALFSLEDSKEQIAMRLAAAQSGVSLYRMRSGYLTDRDWTPLSEGMAQIGGSGLYVDDSPQLTVPELRAKARRLQAMHGLALIVVDYVQLMHAPGKHQNRTMEIGMISAGLKQVAKELRLPVLALAQLNRLTESRKDGRPLLSDMRDSGNLEQDADLACLLYRPEFYEPTDQNAGLAELIIAKQRNGPTGVVRLRFEKEHVRFVPWQE